MKIGLISDTHNYLDPSVFHYFEHVDQIWHAGDIGNVDILESLQKFKPTKAVFGNIDAQDIQSKTMEDLIFDCNGLKIYMTHIGGNFDKFSTRVKNIILNEKPHLYICGHSHIVKVRTKPEWNNLICINPGAAGNEGFHTMKTIMTFEINNAKLEHLKLIELGKRGAIKV